MQGGQGNKLSLCLSALHPADYSMGDLGGRGSFRRAGGLIVALSDKFIIFLNVNRIPHSFTFHSFLNRNSFHLNLPQGFRSHPTSAGLDRSHLVSFRLVYPRSSVAFGLVWFHQVSSGLIRSPQVSSLVSSGFNRSARLVLPPSPELGGGGVFGSSSLPGVRWRW